MTGSVPGPTFSVVVPLFDKRSYVPRALASVRAQSLAPAEVIVVDDGSTDGGGAIVAREFPEVVLLLQDNRGVGAARNAGVARADGDWVAFLDADDFWAPGHLEELARIIRRVPRADLVSTRHREMVEGRPTPALNGPPGRIEEVDYFAAAARDSRVVWTSSAAVRHSVLDVVGAFGPWPVGEDIELWARIALERPVAVSDAETAVYVRGLGGVMERRVATPAGPSPFPTHVSQLGHSCATVVDALDRDDLAVPRASLVRYLDARVIGKMNSALVRGEIGRAKALRRLVQTPWRLRWIGTVGLTLLPGWLLRLARQAVRSLRHA